MADKYLHALAVLVRETHVYVRFDDKDYDPENKDDKAALEEVVRQLMIKDQTRTKPHYEFTHTGVDIKATSIVDSVSKDYFVEDAPRPEDWFKRRFLKAITGYQDPMLDKIPGVVETDIAFLGGSGEDDDRWQCTTVVRRFKLGGSGDVGGWCERVHKLRVEDWFEANSPRYDGGSEHDMAKAAFAFCCEIKDFLQAQWLPATIMRAFCQAFGWSMVWVERVNTGQSLQEALKNAQGH